MHKLKLYVPLIGLTITILLMCDALAFQVISINGHDFAASGLIFPLGFLLASVITEVYGFTLAGRVIWTQLLCQALFVVTVNLFVIIPCPSNSAFSSDYFNLYHNLWHVLLASTTAVSLSYFVNDIIISKLKIYLSGDLFFIRFLISNAMSAAILVSISYPINFYGLYSIGHIEKIAFNTWIYKIIFSVVLFPIAMFLADIIKRIERLDYFDYGISYNPFGVFKENNAGENKYHKFNKIGDYCREGYSDQ